MPKEILQKKEKIEVGGMMGSYGLGKNLSTITFKSPAKSIMDFERMILKKSVN